MFNEMEFVKVICLKNCSAKYNNGIFVNNIYYIHIEELDFLNSDVYCIYHNDISIGSFLRDDFMLLSEYRKKRIKEILDEVN